MSTRRLCSLAICFAVATYGAGARAQTVRVVELVPVDRLPVAYVERGITNPAGILSPEVDPFISHTARYGGVEQENVAEVLLPRSVGIQRLNLPVAGLAADAE